MKQEVVFYLFEVELSQKKKFATIQPEPFGCSVGKVTLVKVIQVDLRDLR